MVEKHKYFFKFIVEYIISMILNFMYRSSQDDTTETDTAASTTATATPIVDNQSKKHSDFKSIFDRIHIGGANSDLYNGPNENLLL